MIDSEASLESIIEGETKLIAFDELINLNTVTYEKIDQIIDLSSDEIKLYLLAGQKGDKESRVIFDPESQRYYLLNRALSDSEVRGLREKNTDKGLEQIDQKVKLLIENKINISDWEVEVSRLLSSQHTISFLLGVGGRNFTQESDIAALNRRIKAELIYLRRLSRNYEQKHISDAMLISRIKMFLRATHGSYEAARQISHQRNGFVWEKRVMSKQENCYSCYIYALKGWQRIGTLPPPTVACECLSNCGCYKIYNKDIFQRI